MRVRSRECRLNLSSTHYECVLLLLTCVARSGTQPFIEIDEGGLRVMYMLLCTRRFSAPMGEVRPWPGMTKSSVRVARNDEEMKQSCVKISPKIRPLVDGVHGHDRWGSMSVMWRHATTSAGRGGGVGTSVEAKESFCMRF